MDVSSHVSLFVTSCGLIVERKYICCTFLVELYTSHQMHIKFDIREILLILILVLLFMMVVFMCIQLGFRPANNTSLNREGATERRVTVKRSRYNE